MPLVDGQYQAPTFVNDSAPALNATEMNAMAGAVEGAVEYDRTQSLSAAQNTAARENIAAIAASAYTAQALAANWVGASAPYTNTITVTGLSATAHIVVGPASTTTAAQFEAISDGEIICAAQAAGSITLTAYGEKPTVDLAMSILAFE